MKKFVPFVCSLILGIAALAFTSAQAKESVLILGGAGNSGSSVAKMLVARGDDVTVLVRATTNRKRLEGVPVKYVVADALNRNQVDAALGDKTYSVIFETVQVEPDSGHSIAEMYENFMPHARRMGVKQFLILGGGCGDRKAEDCPLSPPLFRMQQDMLKAEHLLRDSGIPYTIFRIGALIPSSPLHPDKDLYSGKSYLTTDQSKFGAVLRADMDEQVVNCIGDTRCINKILVMDDPTLKPQLDHWLCKRANEGPVVSGNNPKCGEMPRVQGAKPRTLPTF